MEYNIVKEVKTDAGTICLYDNGILCHTPFRNVTKTSLDILTKDFHIFMKLANNQKVLFFYDARTLFDFTSKQKRYMQDHLPLFARKQAVLLGNGISKFMFNTFLLLYKPPIPIKGFASKKEAFDWLLTE
jgi:ABC-type lipopolysaccharide export system ATPase subunit